MMSTAILTAATASPTAPRWIVSKRQDLIWFIGSALVGYLTVGLISGLQQKGVEQITVFVWSALIAGPHFFATFTRTYLDSDQRTKLSRTLWMIVPLSLLPIIISGFGGHDVLILIGTGWGTFHITKQHVGIIMLYKRVTGERSRIDFTLDKRFLLASHILPLTLFLLWLLSLLPSVVTLVAVATQIGLAGFYLFRQVKKYHRREEMNWPKLMLLALIIPLHWLAFAVGSQSDRITGLLVFSIAVNIGHSIQYHRLMWMHNKNRYRGRQGVSGLVGRSVVCYYGASFALYLFFVIAGTVLPAVAREVIIMGPIFMHYVLDARIWRMREDPDLARALNVA